MVRQEVLHFADTYQLEAAPVRCKNVVSYRPADCALPELGPSLHDTEHTALAEVADHVYETVLHEEVRHLLPRRDPHFIKVHVQVPKENEVLKVFWGLLQVCQVL